MAKNDFQESPKDPSLGFSDTPNENRILVGLRKINHLMISIGSKPFLACGNL